MTDLFGKHKLTSISQKMEEMTRFWPFRSKSHIYIYIYGMQTWLLLLRHIHWNETVILTKFSSLAALDIVILMTSSAANDESVIKMTTFPFQCLLQNFFQLSIMFVTVLVFHNIILISQNSWSDQSKSYSTSRGLIWTSWSPCVHIKSACVHITQGAGSMVSSWPHTSRLPMTEAGQANLGQGNFIHNASG